MKNKLLKVISSVIIICLLTGIVMPTLVKSVEITVTDTNNTGHGVGNTKVYTTKINGFNNIYCVRGGAHLSTGTILNDDGLSLYNTTGEVVKNSNALQWLFDNIYLIDETDSAIKEKMKKNLIKIVKQYSTYKDANGNNALSTKIGVSQSSINDDWINNMVNALIKDTTTLYTVQQYVIWNNVYNYESSYNNTMRNSDGTYNSIPGAKVDKKYYIALYATLDELSKVAQVKGYQSPNNPNSNFDIKIQKQNSTKVTVSDDLKTAMVGPYKLVNNHKYVSKSFSITVDSNRVDSAKIVDKNGGNLDLTESEGEFWIEIKYNKGFAKGENHNININIKLDGYKTYAKLLDSYESYNQPVVSLKKEKYTSTTKTDISIKEELKGNYSLELEKVDSTNNSKKIQGVSFKLKDVSGSEKTYGPTGTDGKINIFTAKPIEQEGIDEYVITEVDLGNNNEYISLKDEVKIYITKSKTDSAYIVSSVSFSKDKQVTNKNVMLQDNTLAIATASVSGNTVKITIPNKPYVKPTDFDLALRKNISEVKRDGEIIDIGEDRNPTINLYSALSYIENKTASYYHTKNPVNVKANDIITYTIRVYNEGYVDGYAKEITDYLPTGLEYIEDSVINKENNWVATKNEDGTTTLKTDKLKDVLIVAANGAEGFSNYTTQQLTEQNNNEPEFCKLIQLECKVKENIENSKLLVNIAEITNYGYNDEQGNYIEANKDKVDIDSEQDNVFNKLENVKNIDTYYENIVKPQYKEDNTNYKGEQDDDDFENVLVQIEETPEIPQIPEIHKGVKDIENQDSGYYGDEEHDWVIQTTIPTGIKQYKKYIVTDEIDTRLVFSGLEKVSVKLGEKELKADEDYKINYDETNRTLKIIFIEDEFLAGQNFEENSIIEIRFKTTFAKDEKGNIIGLNQEIPNKATLIYDNGFGEEEKESEEPEVHTGAVAVYKYNQQTKVALEGAKFKIATSKENAEKGIFVKDASGKDLEAISNEKGIATFDGLEFGGDAISNEENKQADGTYSYNFDEAKKTYYIVETEAPEGFNKYEGIIEVEISKNVTLTEIENMVSIANAPIGEFDLALRKFITGVNDNEVNNRIPVFEIDENGNYIYNHDKEPVLVANSNTVIYTLRVYNEGEVPGYANEIKDDIPNGLEFLSDNEINEKYRWIMFDKYGKETDNADEAEYVTTDYLSKENEKKDGENILNAFNIKDYESGAIKEPDYKEVKIAFKVNMPDMSEEIIINHAQISADSDKNGNEVTDKDSTPNEWINGEDDQDTEKIKIQYFDLALRKWVTKAYVTENGVEKIYETGHKAEDDPEEVVKVDLGKADINNVKVKFEYKIRVENQGKIEGYAIEISDYIPEGLKFVKEDNPLWEEVDGKVVTDQLKDTLLKPGETAEVTILLTWINKEDNMGLKVNVAEISKDYNKYGTPDIDSTPNNQVPGEDDIDDAKVLLSVKTGEESTYIIITTVVLVILATGIVLIKRYVLQ